jgi:hypothetical protein
MVGDVYAFGTGVVFIHQTYFRWHVFCGAVCLLWCSMSLLCNQWTQQAKAGSSRIAPQISGAAR